MAEVETQEAPNQETEGTETEQAQNEESNNESNDFDESKYISKAYHEAELKKLQKQVKGLEQDMERAYDRGKRNIEENDVPEDVLMKIKQEIQSDYETKEEEFKSKFDRFKQGRKLDRLTALVHDDRYGVDPSQRENAQDSLFVDTLMKRSEWDEDGQTLYALDRNGNKIKSKDPDQAYATVEEMMERWPKENPSFSIFYSKNNIKDTQTGLSDASTDGVAMGKSRSSMTDQEAANFIAKHGEDRYLALPR